MQKELFCKESESSKDLMSCPKVFWKTDFSEILEYPDIFICRTPVLKVLSYSLLKRHRCFPKCISVCLLLTVLWCAFLVFNVEVVNAEFSLSHSEHPCVGIAEGWKVLQQIAALGDDCSVQWEGVSNVHVWS